MSASEWWCVVVDVRMFRRAVFCSCTFLFLFFIRECVSLSFLQRIGSFKLGGVQTMAPESDAHTYVTRGAFVDGK